MKLEKANFEIEEKDQQVAKIIAKWKERKQNMDKKNNERQGSSGEYIIGNAFEDALRSPN